MRRERRAAGERPGAHSLLVPRPADLDDVSFVDITFLSHPVDRFQSIYNYFRMPHVRDFPSIPKEASFAEFLEGVRRDAPYHLHSPQVTCLGNERHFHFPPGPAALARAKAVLDTRFLGTVDLIQVSFDTFVECNRVLFQGKDVAALAGPFEPVNGSPNKPLTLEERLAQAALALGPDRYRMLEAACEADLALYWCACAEVLRRHALAFGEEPSR